MTQTPPGTPDVSVVLPVYNERANLAPLLAEIAEALATRPHEILAVDDASTDGSLPELRRLEARYAQLHTRALARRSGQSAALVAGFGLVRAPLIATLDADGQNDPADLLALLQAVGDGLADAAVGVRIGRQDSAWKQVQSRIANRVRDWITGDHVRDTGCSLRVMRREFVDRLPRFDGMHRFLPTLLRREGARVVEIEVSHRPRRHGQTKYGMWDRLFAGLRDALGVRWFLRGQLSIPVKEDPPT